MQEAAFMLYPCERERAGRSATTVLAGDATGGVGILVLSLRNSVINTLEEHPEGEGPFD